MTIETLKNEINILNLLSKDMSFDKTVLDDAVSIIQIKNKQITDLGGEPIVFEVNQSVGLTEDEFIRQIVKKMGVYKRFIASNPVAQKKYNLLDSMLKRKTGVSYQQYLDKGEKFFLGGNIKTESHMIFNNLLQTNEFVFVRETRDDSVLRYTTPENSVLFQVLTPETNVLFALGYFVGDDFILDFYEDEILSKSLNLTYSFTATYSLKDFKLQYIKLKKKLKEIDKKIV